MGHTSVVDLSDTTFANNIEQGKGSFNVALNNANIAIPSGVNGDFHTIQLETPFYYNGVDNVVVEFEHTAACSATVGHRSENRTNSRLYTLTSGSATGTPSNYHYHMKFNFAGGDNTVLASDDAGDNGNNLAPGHTGRTQALILQEDIDGRGPITGIAFEASATALTADAVATYTIMLSHVDAGTDAVVATYADNVGTGVTTVVQDLSMTVPAGTKWFWIPLSGTFNYDGTSNLLIDITATVSSGSFTVDYHNAGSNRIVYSGNTADVTGSVRLRTFQPKLRFNGAPVQVMFGMNISSSQILGSNTDGQIQNMYPAAYVGTGGSISSVSVRLNGNGNAGTIPSHKIYMGHTTKNVLNIADAYNTNMDSMVLVYDSTLDVTAGLLQGDWVNIPLQTSFNYDPGKNLVVMFASNDSGVSNPVSFSDTLLTYTVGRNDNAVDTTGTPTFDYNGFANVQLVINK
jgi:hypothetical protein